MMNDSKFNCVNVTIADTFGAKFLEPDSLLIFSVIRGRANISSPSSGVEEAPIVHSVRSSTPRPECRQMVAMSIGTTGKVTAGSVIKSLEVFLREALGNDEGKLVVILQNTR